MLFSLLWYIALPIITLYGFFRLFLSKYTSRYAVIWVCLTIFIFTLAFFTGLIWQAFFGPPDFFGTVHLNSDVMDGYWESIAESHPEAPLWSILPVPYVGVWQIVSWWWQFHTTYASICLYVADAIALVFSHSMAKIFFYNKKLADPTYGFGPKNRR